MLTRGERYELQQLLARRGYDVGEPDGRLGARTATALRVFQTAIGAVPDGFASAAILDRLRSRQRRLPVVRGNHNPIFKLTFLG